jgi:crossover junction endodeoxyribonuclease RuvC
VRVLGIDPGTAALGYGIVEGTAAGVRALDFGCLETSADEDLPARLLTIHRFLGDLFALHRPDLVAVERLFFSRNVQTAIAVGQARGVVLLAAAEASVPVREATPSEIKAAVAGHGAAGKAEMARMVQVSLGLSELPTPDDAADALAAGIWAATRERAGSSAERSAVLDRSAAAPIERGESSFDRAVREALAAEAARSGSN